MNTALKAFGTFVIGAVIAFESGGALGRTQKWEHYKIPPFDSTILEDAIPDPGSTFDAFWVFSNADDMTLSDAERPALILDLQGASIVSTVPASGPWLASRTKIDPFGIEHPYLGVMFTLQAGGSPIQGDGAVVVAATEDFVSSQLVTAYWNDSVLGYQSASGSPVDISFPLPGNLQTAAQRSRYIWNNSIPEPSTALLLIVALVGLGAFMATNGREISRWPLDGGERRLARVMRTEGLFMVASTST